MLKRSSGVRRVGWGLSQADRGPPAGTRWGEEDKIPDARRKGAGR